MTGLPNAPSFPWRAVAGFAFGWLAVAAASHLVRNDPLRDLPAAGVPEAAITPLENLPPAPAGGTRIFVVGASETMGYPYEPALEASYATLLGAGLAAALPAANVETHVAASTALDSGRLAELVARLARQRPTVFVVTLGNNEFGNRIVAGRTLDPADLPGRLADRLGRTRALWAALPLPVDPLRARRAEAANVEGLPLRIKDARPAQPVFGGLPVGERDQRRIVLRLHRNLAAIAAAARTCGARLVFAVAPYNLAGAWPFGMVEVDREIDALAVRAHRGEPVTLAEIDARLRSQPARADLHFLRGRALRAAGAAAAGAALWDALDRDPAPMHTTRDVDETITAAAAGLGVPCVRLEMALRDADGLPATARFLDHAHLDLEGHRAVARFLAQELSRLGVVPALPTGWEAAFDAAGRARQGNVTQLSRDRARMRNAWTQATLALLCGNFRDALFTMRDGLAEMALPANREFGAQQLASSGQDFLFALFAYTDRLAEDSAPARRQHWFRRLTEELAHGRGPDRVLDEVLR